MTQGVKTAVEAITSNPVQTRSDLVSLLLSLLQPLLSAQSPGGARISLSGTGAGFDQPAAELEGFARALWGLAPLLALQPDHPDFRSIREIWVAGLDAGTDPDNEEYWGNPGHRDQRYVEMGAIAFSIALAPKVFWFSLSEKTKSNVTRWLLEINHHTLPVSNWRFFRVLVNLAMKLVGSSYSQDVIDEELAVIETFYGEQGLPADGVNETCRSYDYYATSFAIPFYSLIYARLQSTTDPETATRYRDRARRNLIPAINLFAPNGACIPFGRSMTYRFACSSIFAAVAFDGLELPLGLTWGHIKGLLLRNIRWFTNRSKVFARDGSLTVGWAYPSLFMSEDYNSPQSPYWALKSFLVLALQTSHPFWTATEEPYPMHLFPRPNTIMRPWGQVFTHAAGHTFCLAAGQQVRFPMRHAAAKYGKMAYSAAFGFSVPTGALGLSQHAPDSTLALSDDAGEVWKVRRVAEDVSISSRGVIRSVWRPWPDVQVVTWLIPPATKMSPYHTRVHRIINRSRRNLTAADSGFAIDSQSGPSNHRRHISRIAKVTAIATHGRYESSRGCSAAVVSPAGIVGVVDLMGTGHAVVQDADANSNLIAERTVIPMVLTKIREEAVWLASHIYAKPAQEGADQCSDEAVIMSWTKCEAAAGSGLASLGHLWEKDHDSIQLEDRL